METYRESKTAKKKRRFLVVSISLAVGLGIDLQMSRFSVHGHYAIGIDYALIWLNLVLT